MKDRKAQLKHAYLLVKAEALAREKRVSETGIPEGFAHGLLEQMAEEYEREYVRSVRVNFS